jgi:hypothetical protein
MPLPLPSPVIPKWQRIGTIAPKFHWQDSQLFADSLGSCRVSAFSLMGDYGGMLLIRVKYHLSSPIFSKSLKYYPSNEFNLYQLPIDPALATIPKTVQIRDSRRADRWTKPEPLKITVFLDLLYF